MADFVIEGGFDDRQILEGFRKLVAAGEESGQKVGAGFEDSLNRFGKRSIAALQQDLAKLQSRQLRLNVDSEAFTKTSAKIKEIQGLIDQASRKKLALQFDAGSINGLSARLQAVQAQALELKVGTDGYRRAQLQVAALQKRIQDLGKLPVTAGSIEALNQELSRLQARQVRLNVDSRAFASVQAQIRAVEQQIDEANRKKVSIGVNPESINGLTARLQQLQSRTVELKVGTKEYRDAQLQVASLQQRIQELGKVPVTAGSLEALQQQLTKLQQRQVRLNIDSRAFAAVEVQIREVQQQIDAANRKKLAIQFDPNSINGLNAKLQELQSQALNLRVGTDEYRRAQVEVAALQKKIQDVSRVPVKAGSLEALNRELQDLQAKQITLNVDSRQFARAEAQIREVQQRIDGVNQRRLLLNADSNSITAVRARLQEVQTRLDRVAIGSRAFATLSREAKAAEQTLAKVSGTTGNLASQLVDFALPGAGAIGILLAIAAAVKYVVEQVKGLDSASAAVRTLGVDSEALAGRLKLVSDATGGQRSQIELLTAAYDVASSGFATAAGASQVLEASARGAAGGFADIATVADATTSVLNAYGLGADQAASLVDKFIQTQNDGKIVLSEYGSLIGRVAPIAASAGVSIDELNAAIAVSTASGVKPGAAIDGLRQAIGAILKPSADAEALANKLGIGFSAQALKAKGLTGVLADIAEKTKGSTALNLQLFGSVEALAAVQPSLNDGLVKYGQALENQSKSAGAAKKAADEVANTVEGASKRVQVATSNLAASIGVAFGPALKSALKGIADALDGISASTAAGDIFNSFGTSVAQSRQLAGSLQAVQSLYGLTAQQAKNLLSNALANTGATRNVFGQLSLSSGQFGRVLSDLDNLSRAYRDKQLSGAKAGTAANEDETLSLAQQVAILRQIGATRDALNKVQDRKPLEAVSGQLQTAQDLVGLSGSLSNLEQARFATVRARGQYEIDNAQRLGLSQEQIAARKAQADELEKQALIAKYQASLKQQQIEEVSLALKQRQAQIEAQLAVLDQQRAVVKAQANLLSAERSLDPQRIADAQNLLQSEQLSLGFVKAKLGILNQLAPIEQQITRANAETAQQQLLQQGAALGIEGLLRSQSVAAQDQTNAWRQTVQEVTRFPGELNTITKLTGDTAQDVQDLGQGFIQVGNTIKTFGSDSKLKAATADAATSARTFSSEMANAANNADRIYRSLTAAAGLAPSRFIGGPVQAGGRYRINDGPGGRPLGQESFLSSGGDLSLIQRPANSLWRAPSSGLVIPAAVTARLRKQGAFAGGGRAVMRSFRQAPGLQPRNGGGAGTERLELAVANLAAQVRVLNQKEWLARVQVRNLGGASQVRAMNSQL